MQVQSEEFFLVIYFHTGYNEHSDLKDEYPPEYRNNQRLIFLSKELARNLWNRLLPHLTEGDIQNITPYGYGTKGNFGIYNLPFFFYEN